MLIWLKTLCSLALAATCQLVLPGLFAGATLACASPEAVPTHAAALSETRPPWRVEVYVWQRHVHAGVLSSMASVSAGGHVQRFNLLAAELAGGGAQPRVTPIDLRPYADIALASFGRTQELSINRRTGSRNWPREGPGKTHSDIALASFGRMVALSVRVASLRGSLRDHDSVLWALAHALLDVRRRALAAGLRPSELQVDFDATRGQLADYARWLIALKAALPDVPLTFTALPDWLRSPDFAGLARAADGFVLQVHALPDRAGPRTLCDPRAARRAAAAADTFGVPFRVALPTYSYGVARDARGRLVGVLAEGAAPRWPEGTRVEELRAEPADMLALAKALASAGHRHLRGLLWYRLPVPGDVRAWPLTTFLAVLAGRSPRPSLHASVRARNWSSTSLDLELYNSGDAPAPLPRAVSITAPVVAADAFAGYRAERAASSRLTFARDPQAGATALAPGERRTLGWFRLSQDGLPLPTPTLEE